MPRSVTPTLMFHGDAEDAMTFHLSILPGSEPGEVERWGEDEPGETGSLKTALATIGGQGVRYVGSPMPHDFGFTPSFSFFVECETEEELDSAFAKLDDGGQALMPPGDHGFSRKFAWVQDRFGVSWQLNLA